MSENKHYPEGSFCWVDLGTSDPQAAKDFYNTLVGWGYEDGTMPDGQIYTGVRLQNQDIGGLYLLNEEQKKHGVPPHWLSYVKVASVDTATEKCQSLGGKVLLQPMDVCDIGRMSVLQDPTGGVLATWEAKTHHGATVAPKALGTVCWQELMSSNVDQAGKFYSDLFGWTIKVHDMPDTKYYEFGISERSVGGMMAIDPKWGNVPSHWLVYFHVADCDQATKTVETMGGQVKLAPMDVPDVGRFSIVMDPQTAAFGLATLK